MAVRGQLRDPRGGLGRRGALAAAGGVLAALIAFPAPVGAAPNQLSQGAVSPVAGTTATPFAFSVQYLGKAPSGVVALAGSTIVPLSLSSGTPEDGSWSGSAFLPVGTHPVSFQATARGNSASLDGPTLTVTPAPPPSTGPAPASPGATALPSTAPATPMPTPPPGARPPRLAPTPLPAGPSPASIPSALPSPGASGFVGGVVSTPRPSPTGRQTSGEAPPAVADGDPLTVVAGAMVAAVILAMIAMVALARDRRRRRLPDRPLSHLAAPPGVAADASPAHSASAAGRGEWEASALDDLPIGTVEYEPPPPRAEG